MNDNELIKYLTWEIEHGDCGDECDSIIQEWLHETPEHGLAVKLTMEGWKITLDRNELLGTWTATITTNTSKQSTTKNNANDLAHWIMEAFL